MDLNPNRWFSQFNHSLSGPAQQLAVYEVQPTPQDEDQDNDYEEGEISEGEGTNMGGSQSTSSSNESGEIEEDNSAKYDPTQPLLPGFRDTPQVTLCYGRAEAEMLTLYEAGSTGDTYSNP